jgi:hypothetical protein
MIKNCGRVSGIALAIMSAVWIVWQFAHQQAWSHLSDPAVWERLGAGILIGVPVYLAGLCLIAFAWCRLQNDVSIERTSYRCLFAVYATSQFAKYMPGNIGHYVGRHLLLRGRGHGHAAIVFGTLAEAAMLIVAAGAWSFPVLVRWWPGLAWPGGRWICFGMGWLLVLVGLFLLRWFARTRVPLLHRLPLIRPWRVAALFPLYGLFFLAMSLAVALPAHALGLASTSFFSFAVAVAASWMVGFLIVGAPAGIGVREAALLLLLQGQLAREDILLLAAAFRVISFVADLFMLLIGAVLMARTPDQRAGGDRSIPKERSGQMGG